MIKILISLIISPKEVTLCWAPWHLDSGESAAFLQEALRGRRKEYSGAQTLPKVPSRCLEDQTRKTGLQKQ